MDTRPGAKLFFGFQKGVTEEDFRQAIEDSETDKDAMERLMCEITPKKGEVYFVPARTVHAIGAGCLILEVQEPTDFTIQPERYCGDYRLSDAEMFMGLDKDTAVQCFSFGEQPVSYIAPRQVSNDNGVTAEELVSAENTDCFVINRIRLHGGECFLHVADSYAIYIVTEGSAVLRGENYARVVKKGDYFLMPASLMGQFTVNGQAEIVECY